MATAVAAEGQEKGDTDVAGEDNDSVARCVGGLWKFGTIVVLLLALLTPQHLWADGSSFCFVFVVQSTVQRPGLRIRFLL